MRIFPRQPDKLVITPSGQSPWVGFPEAAGDRFTAAQAYWMRARGLDPAACEAITVFREATSREMYWGAGCAPPVFQFDCPVLGRRADGKVKVLAPSGEGKFVLANGWVRLPSRLNLNVLGEQIAATLDGRLGAVLAARINAHPFAAGDCLAECDELAALGLLEVSGRSFRFTDAGRGVRDFLRSAAAPGAAAA